MMNMHFVGCQNILGILDCSLAKVFPPGLILQNTYVFMGIIYFCNAVSYINPSYVQFYERAPSMYIKPYVQVGNT